MKLNTLSLVLLILSQNALATGTCKTDDNLNFVDQPEQGTLVDYYVVDTSVPAWQCQEPSVSHQEISFCKRSDQSMYIVELEAMRGSSGVRLPGDEVVKSTSLLDGGTTYWTRTGIRLDVSADKNKLQVLESNPYIQNGAYQCLRSMKRSRK